MPLFTLAFDIDKHLNPFIPPSFLHQLPYPISYFLGHHHKPNPKLPTLLHATWAFVGAFGGIALIEAVYSAPSLQEHGAPLILASLGASAILTYNTLDSPLSQPRNLLLGHTLSTLLGISTTKLFLLLPPSTFLTYRWLAGALSVAISSFVMTVTKTVHPPAGATALLAATSTEVTALGWYLLPLILLGDVLMLASGCLVNNASGRAWPLYWWVAGDLRRVQEEEKKKKKRRRMRRNAAAAAAAAGDGAEAGPGVGDGDLEKGLSSHYDGTGTDEAGSAAGTDLTRVVSAPPPPEGMNIEGDRRRARRKEEREVQRQVEAAGRGEEWESEGGEDRILILPDRLALPGWLELGTEELGVLEDLQARMRESLREALVEVEAGGEGREGSPRRSLSTSRKRKRRRRGSLVVR